MFDQIWSYQLIGGGLLLVLISSGVKAKLIWK
jgi:hypothetical protein